MAHMELMTQPYKTLAEMKKFCCLRYDERINLQINVNTFEASSSF